MEANVRRQVINVERVWRDRGPRLDKPVRRGWAAAVIENPFAGRYETELVSFMESLEPLAYQLGMTSGNIGQGAAVALFMLPILATVIVFQLWYLRRQGVR